jgi:uncharacterized protein (TIGR00369 family)
MSVPAAARDEPRPPAGRTPTPDGHAAALAGQLAAAPVERGAGLVPLLFGPGTASFEVAATGGPGDLFRLAVGVDVALGVAVHSGMPEPMMGPTLDLRLDRAAEPAPGNRRFRLDGEFRGHSNSAGTGAVVVRDETGQPVAHAVGTMVLEPQLVDREHRIARLTGIPPFDPDAAAEQVRRADVTGTEVRLPLSPSLANPRGTVHGGVVLALGCYAQDLLPGPVTTTLSIAVDYLRPLPLTGAVTCRTEPVRSGRRFRTLRSELLLDDGRTAAVVTTTREVRR